MRRWEAVVLGAGALVLCCTFLPPLYEEVGRMAQVLLSGVITGALLSNVGSKP
jgi:hypothetical protein